MQAFRQIALLTFCILGNRFAFYELFYWMLQQFSKFFCVLILFKIEFFGCIPIRGIEKPKFFY